jgi:hypothetical protein
MEESISFKPTDDEQEGMLLRIEDAIKQREHQQKV